MAIDVCYEISSPRISFSHDLKDLDSIPIENHTLLLNPTIDFDFDFSSNTPHEISSADELFANGKILTVEMKKRNPPKQSEPQKKRLIEYLSTTFSDRFEKPSQKPFWLFRKSSSVNCENARSNNGDGLLRSLHFFTRSKSTGSVLNLKKSSSFLLQNKQNSSQENSIRREKYSSLNQYYPYNNAKKPFLKKSTSISYGKGVRVNPVLNIHPTYIAKGTVSLFGIGSFFCSKKSKKKRN